MLRGEFYIRAVNGITTTVSSSARNIKPAVLHGGQYPSSDGTGADSQGEPELPLTH